VEVNEYVGLPPLLGLSAEENQYYQFWLSPRCDQLHLDALTSSIARLFFFFNLQGCNCAYTIRQFLLVTFCICLSFVLKLNNFSIADIQISNLDNFNTV